MTGCRYTRMVDVKSAVSFMTPAVGLSPTLAIQSLNRFLFQFTPR